jgi:HEAT repeat protein
VIALYPTLMTVSRTLVIALTLAAAPDSAPLAAQTPQRPSSRQAPARRAGSVSVEDATELTNGWAQLAEGRPVQALIRAQRVLGKEPRSIAGLVLAIEADIANHGAAAGLAQYEHWLGARTLEEPGALRRIARAVLVEGATQKGDQGARIEALRGLAADGDAQAAREVTDLIAHGAIPTRSRAALGDERAVGALIAQLNQGGPGQVQTIDALGQSGNALAIPSLVARLRDPRQEIRAAALDALGRLGDTDIVPQLTPLLSDSNLRVRVSAAGALLQLGDFGGVQMLQGLMTDPSPSARLLAAQALASHPDGSWIAVVRELAMGEDPEIRAAAARLLGPHDPEFARAVLNALATDDNPALRDLAALDLGEVATSDLTALRGLMKSDAPLTRVKAAAQLLAVTR